MLGVAVANCCLVLPWRDEGISAKENDRSNASQRSARNLVRARGYEVRSDHSIAPGDCENFSSLAEKRAYQREALADLKEAHELCSEQLEARNDTCCDLPDRPYNPWTLAADFVAGITTEPDGNENRTCAPGVGLALEVNVRDRGTRTELVQIPGEGYGRRVVASQRCFPAFTATGGACWLI